MLGLPKYWQTEKLGYNKLGSENSVIRNIFSSQMGHLVHKLTRLYGLRTLTITNKTGSFRVAHYIRISLNW